MMLDDDRWLAVTDAFNAAAVGACHWLDALGGLADATGSRSGELIGLGSDHAIPFNWVTDLGPDWVEEFAAIDGGNPDVNPFVRLGARAAPLQVATSGDMITAEERRTNPFLADHARRHDIQHICLSSLIKQRDLLVGLAVIRSGSEGEIDAEGKAFFASVAPHVRAAVRTQMSLEHQGALLVANALEALSLAVFVCDRRGAVRAMTPAAEKCIGAGGSLRLRGGALSTASQMESRALSEAIARAAAQPRGPAPPASSTIFVRQALGLPLVLEVVRMPRRQSALAFDARALVIVRGVQRDTSSLDTLLRAAYGLTAAESDVASRLLDGESPDAIAANRQSSLATVRAQIRSVYAKLDVHSIGELTSLLNRLR